jgi:hypothetical protein
VFENRMLRRIFRPKRDEVTGEMRKQPNVDIKDLHCSANNIQVIKSRRKWWAGHVTRMGRIQVHTGIWWGYLKRRDHLEVPGVDGRIILRWIF